VAKPIRELLSADAFEHAIDLSEVVGGASYGWLRDDALAVVDEAERAHVVILGGDVWLRVRERIEHSAGIDNWFVEDVGIKPTDDDVARCAENARRYISAYPVVDTNEAKPVFEFVFGETSLGH
jgi:hypothetical protein